MFKPDGDSIAVPVKVIRWWWTGEVVQLVGSPNPSTNDPPSAAACGQAIEATSPNEWNALFENLPSALADWVAGD